MFLLTITDVVCGQPLVYNIQTGCALHFNILALWDGKLENCGQILRKNIAQVRLPANVGNSQVCLPHPSRVGGEDHLGHLHHAQHDGDLSFFLSQKLFLELLQIYLGHDHHCAFLRKMKDMSPPRQINFYFTNAMLHHHHIHYCHG